jgi:hypothetical protein
MEIMPLKVTLAPLFINPMASTIPKRWDIQTSDVNSKLAPVNVEP